MVSTFTPNIDLEEPARGDDVGVWDTPVNNNMTLLDLIAGGTATISLNNANVLLNAAQFRCKTLIFNSTLTGSVIITFSSTFVKSYEIWNQCTGSSAFTISLSPPAGASPVICAPPGIVADVYFDGTQFQYKSLGPVGSYWDYAGSSVPNWVGGCTVKPYLNCDGTTFSSSTYVQLAVILGSTTLPDSKGRSRFALDQSAGRISSAAAGFSGSSVGSGGGGQTTTLGTSNLPAYTPSGAVALNSLQLSMRSVSQTGGDLTTQVSAGNSGGTNDGLQTVTQTSSLAFTGVAQGGVSQAMTNLPPAYIGGLTLIRTG